MNLLQREQASLKQGWPRILAVLTCLTMVLVVAQQGSTIAVQRNLIQSLCGDSNELFRIRVQALAKQRDKVYATDPQYAAPREEPPAAQAPAPPPEATPAKPAPPAETLKPARVLWRI